MRKRRRFHFANSLECVFASQGNLVASIDVIRKQARWVARPLMRDWVADKWSDWSVSVHDLEGDLDPVGFRST